MSKKMLVVVLSVGGAIAGFLACASSKDERQEASKAEVLSAARVGSNWEALNTRY